MNFYQHIIRWWLAYKLYGVDVIAIERSFNLNFPWRPAKRSHARINISMNRGKRKTNETNQEEFHLIWFALALHRWIFGMVLMRWVDHLQSIIWEKKKKIYCGNTISQANHCKRRPIKPYFAFDITIRASSKYGT